MNNLELLLTIIGTFLSVLGVPQLFGKSWKDAFAKLLNGGISWKEVEKLTSSIISQMKEDNVQPDLIIGVGRGGIISAGLLCSTLTNDDGLASQDSQSRNITIETVNTVKKPLAINPQFNGNRVTLPWIYEVQKIDFDLSAWKNKSVLVVIGETITGRTLSSIKKQIEDLCVSGDYSIDVKFATLVLHDTRHYVVDIDINYIGEEYKRQIMMPWKY